MEIQASQDLWVNQVQQVKLDLQVSREFLDLLDQLDKGDPKELQELLVTEANPEM